MAKAKDYLGIASIFVFILTFAISFVILFTPLYSWTISRLNIPQALGMSHETLMENYYVLLEYLHSPFIQELRLPDFPSSASGLFHFYEVKRLFFLNYFLLFLSFILGGLYLYSVHKNDRWYVLIKPFKILNFVPLGLMLILLISFDWLFVVFHRILFNNEAWLFNPATDPIILALPQEFFMYCFILAFIIIQGLLLFFYVYSKRKFKQKLS